MPYYTPECKTVYYYGEPALEAITDLTSRYRQPQVFGDILNSCRTYGTSFVDPEFPHDDSSVGDIGKLFDTANPQMAASVAQWKQEGWTGSASWIRVADLCTQIYGQAYTACFSCGNIGNTIARNDVQQGSTGDCWFLCSVSAISMVPTLIQNVVPTDNSNNPQGVYHFRFWYQGAWVDIVVDDYLPCISTTRQLFTIGSNFYPNNGKAEFWPMMVEKAYAKLNGGYSRIAFNFIVNALENLTGGFGQFIQINTGVPADTFQTMLTWFDRGAVVGAGTAGPGRDGIVGGHAYSITGVHVVTTDDGYEHKLVRLRNPWGRSEWNGAWSDDSPYWQRVSQQQKEAIGFIQKNEGEFWMSYEDLLTHYADIDGCYYFGPGDLVFYSRMFAQFNCSWSIAANTAGGFVSPWNNPKFEVEIFTSKPTGVLVVGILMLIKLKEDLKHGNSIRLFPATGATVYDQNFFYSHKEIFPSGKSSVPGNMFRSFNLVYDVPPGKYVVVPCSLEPNIEAKFVVRICNEGVSPATQVTTVGYYGGSQAWY